MIVVWGSWVREALCPYYCQPTGVDSQKMPAISPGGGPEGAIPALGLAARNKTIPRKLHSGPVSCFCLNSWVALNCSLLSLVAAAEPYFMMHEMAVLAAPIQQEARPALESLSTSAHYARGSREPIVGAMQRDQSHHASHALILITC